MLSLAALAACLFACGGNHSGTLTDLRGVEDLKARFNADAGKPRIVLLLSPT